MFKKLKFKETDQKIWISSDWHYGHDPKWENPLWKMRGYSSVGKMNRDIIDKVNAKVGPDDILFNCGDLALNSSVDAVENLLKQLICQNIYYIWGNHESATSKIYKKAISDVSNVGDCEIYPLRFKNIIFVGNYLEVTIGNQPFVFTHFPMRNWNCIQHGAVSISGHSHGNDIERTKDWQKGKALDVSWDGKNDVYSVAEILEIMDKKEIFSADHHDNSRE